MCSADPGPVKKGPPRAKARRARWSDGGRAVMARVPLVVELPKTRQYTMAIMRRNDGYHHAKGMDQ